MTFFPVRTGDEACDLSRVVGVEFGLGWSIRASWCAWLPIEVLGRFLYSGLTCFCRFLTVRVVSVDVGSEYAVPGEREFQPNRVRASNVTGALSGRTGDVAFRIRTAVAVMPCKNRRAAG